MIFAQRIALAATITLMMSPVVAQASIYDQCISAINGGSDETVERLAVQIRRFNTHPATEVASAERCVSAAEGVSMRLEQGSGQFMTDAEFGARIVEREEEQETRERSLVEKKRSEDEAQQLAETRERLNRILIAGDVLTACTDLYARDFISAMTNQTCVESFRSNGHPRLAEALDDIQVAE